MTVDRDKIVKFCEEHLKVKNFTDYCVNGLQVEGSKKISKIITGVSFSKRLIESAIRKKAQMIIVHHGLFGDQIDKPPQLKGYLKNRLKLLLPYEINLAGFHLPLDAHPLIGNNISLCKLLGVNHTKPLDVGFIGRFKKEISFTDLVNLVNKKLSVVAYVIPVGPKKVKSIGIISGGAAKDFQQAAELGADVFLCGEIRESIVEAVKESKINFINAGHYNTEKLGIQNLGKLISKKFKISVEFVDIPNEI